MEAIAAAFAATIDFQRHNVFKRRRWPRDTRSSTKATLNATTHTKRATAQLIVWPSWKMGKEGGKEDATFNTSSRESGLAYQLNTLSVKVVQVAETMIACEVVADSIVAIATATFNRWKRRDIIPISAQYVATRGGGHTAGIT